MKKLRFSTNVSLFSEMIQDIAIVTVEDECELLCNLSNCIISSDHEWPLT